VVAIGGDRMTAGLSDSMGISYLEREHQSRHAFPRFQQNLEPLIYPLGRELRARWKLLSSTRKTDGRSIHLGRFGPKRFRCAVSPGGIGRAVPKLEPAENSADGI